MDEALPVRHNNTTLDHLMGGKLHIRQPATGHRGGTDTMLLAAAAPLSSGTLVDIGAGVGTAGLAVALREGSGRIILVEIQPDIAALARENIELNGLAERAQAICADVLSAAGRRAAGLTNGIADVVIANPPYLVPGRTRTSPDLARATAHSLAKGGLEAWARAAAALLHPGGQFVMIQRADALEEILPAFAGRFGGLDLIFVHPREGEPAVRMIARATKGSRGPVRILPPLIVHGPGGDFTARAKAIHMGEEFL